LQELFDKLTIFRWVIPIFPAKRQTTIGKLSLTLLLVATSYTTMNLHILSFYALISPLFKLYPVKAVTLKQLFITIKGQTKRRS